MDNYPSAWFSLAAFAAIIVLTLLLHWSMSSWSIVMALVAAAGTLLSRGEVADHHLHGLRNARMPLVLMAAGALTFLAPQIVRMGGTESNAGWDPPVFGPGDTTRYEFDEDIVTVDGKWAGRGSAALYVDGKDAPVSLKTSSRSQDWESRIVTRASRNPETPWIDVTIPHDEELVGARGRIELRLDARYPLQGDMGEFSIAEKTYEAEPRAVLSEVGAGGRYRWWWTGLSVLGALLFAGGMGWIESHHLARGRAAGPLPPPPMTEPSPPSRLKRRVNVKALGDELRRIHQLRGSGHLSAQQRLEQIQEVLRRAMPIARDGGQEREAYELLGVLLSEGVLDKQDVNFARTLP